MAEENDEIIAEAKKFAAASANTYGKSMQRATADLVFFGSNDFSDQDRKIRGEEGERAEIVINTVRNYCNQIINKFRAKPFGVDLQARTTGSTQKLDNAKALIKGIEAKEGGPQSYFQAFERTVKGGQSYLLVTTDYAGEETFDQKIMISAIDSHTMVAWDPFDKTFDGSKATKCLVIEHLPKDVASQAYGPEVTWHKPGDGVMGATDWAAPEDAVELVTYYRLKKAKTKIYQGEDGAVLAQDKVRKNSKLKSRDSQKVTCEVIKICGTTVISKTELPLSRLPVVPVRGERIDTSDKQSDFVGLVHFAKNPARLVNFSASLIAERLALGIKAQNYIDIDAIEPYLDVAEKLNRLNLPFVPLKLWDEENKRERSMPVQTSSAQVGDVTAALAEYRSLLSVVAGMPEGGSEVDGPANMTATEILTKARSADLANFQFLDNMSLSIKAIGKIILELLNIIYDTPRMVPLKKGDDLMIEEVDVQAMGIIPSEFEVEVTDGPLYATQQAESLSQLLALASLLGPEGAWALAPRIAKATNIPDSEGLAKELAIVANKQLGINLEQNPEEDPDAVAALEQASQAVDALQSQVDQANLYISQMQVERQVAEIEAKAKLMAQQMGDNTKIYLKQMEIAASSEEQQTAIRAEYDMKQEELRAELLKLYAAQPQIIIPERAVAPEYTSIGGQRNDIFQ
jgi:hypothetical protein